MRVISDTKVPVKVWASDLEPEAEEQVKRIANLPFIFKHVALMPDAHAGKGSTVGTVIATRGAIIPAAVGVDIGCGMCAIKLPFSADFICNRVALTDLRHSIERAVPTGFHQNKEVTERVKTRFQELGLYRQENLFSSREKAALQLGSLGGGNHFIEICKDTEGGAWIMLHSGSRNIGKALAEKHIKHAQGAMKKFFIELPDPDLAYLVRDTEEYDNYVHDLMWAQKYAMENRNEMMDRVVEQVYRLVYKDSWLPTMLHDMSRDVFRVNCHHNYTSLENHFDTNVIVTRKGAVSAKEGEYGIIPGSMGTKSYIVRGRGNPDSFCSCSHGAGRRMSRTKARKTFTVEDLKAQTEGVECRKDNAVLDEIPASYKDIDQVMSDQADLVEVVYELKQLICVKGAD